MWLNYQNIDVSFGDKTVLRKLSFELHEGEIACLLGHSGCGKTTALRTIAGFEVPSSGSIKLNEQILHDAKTNLPAHQRHIGMVFQDYALFSHLNVTQNIGFGLHALTKAQKKERVNQLLDLINLQDCAKLYPHQLSGGQQQRVALARALAPKPKLVLLDEPFSNLDVDLRQRLSKEVRNILKNEGTSAILVTHDQQEAFAMADKIGVLHEGELQQWDTPYKLYHEPKNRFVAQFIGQGVLLPAKISGAQCVSLEIGEFCGALPLGFNVGEEVDVLLRPDDVIHDDRSLLKATVKGKDFKGEIFTYTLQLDSGQTILAQVPSHHNHNEGEAIGIKLELDHLIAFK